MYRYSLNIENHIFSDFLKYFGIYIIHLWMHINRNIISKNMYKILYSTWESSDENDLCIHSSILQCILYNVWCMQLNVVYFPKYTTLIHWLHLQMKYIYKNVTCIYKIYTLFQFRCKYIYWTDVAILLNIETFIELKHWSLFPSLKLSFHFYYLSLKYRK